MVHIELNNPTIKKAEHYIRMVGLGTLNGCMLVGPPGMGKTHIVCNTLKTMEKKFVLYGGHISLAETYEFLFENHDKLIFFDDVSQVIGKTEIMELLKQALNTNGKRVLSYRSKGVLSKDCPKEFAFDGQVIFAFNIMDKNNPNVKAIMDRAPLIELKYSMKDIKDAMMAIANGPGGIIPNHEKLIVTKCILDYVDSTMDVSLRKQDLAFKIYYSFKKMYGAGNEFWEDQVRQTFGKKRTSWIEEMMVDLVGKTGSLKRTEFAKEIALRKDMSLRTAQRRINEYIEMEILFQNKMKAGDLSLKPFK